MTSSPYMNLEEKLCVQITDNTNRSVPMINCIAHVPRMVASGARGESKQSFKPFRLQIRHSEMQFTASLTF